MIPVPLVALINASLNYCLDMILKIELRIKYMLKILCSDLTATSDPFKNTDRWNSCIVSLEEDSLYGLLAIKLLSSTGIRFI